MKRKILKDVIVDRKSKYTVVYNYVENREQLDEFIKILKQDKYFKKAIFFSGWQLSARTLLLFYFPIIDKQL